MKAAPTLLVLLLLATATQAQAGPCAHMAGPLTRALNQQELNMMRTFVHAVAIHEGVDPFALEAIGMTETGMRSSIGDACELGQFQIMPWWAERFGLSRPELLLDPRIGAIAAARIYEYGWSLWRPEFAKLGASACFGGKKSKKLDRLVFAAAVYNYGRTPQLLASVRDPRRVKLPASTCAYARRFEVELQRARARGIAR